MYCNKCDSKLHENSNFCHICGNKVELPEDSKSETLKVEEPKIESKPEKKSEKKSKNKSKNKKPKSEISFLDKLKSSKNKEDDKDDISSTDDDLAVKLRETPKDEDLDFSKEKLYPKDNDYKITTKKSKNNKTKKSEELSNESDEIETKKSHSESTFKRFINYMKEEEEYDKSILNRNKPEIKYSELEETDVKNLSEDSEELETQINERVLVDDFEDEKEKDSLKVEIKSKNLETNEEDILYIESESELDEDIPHLDDTKSEVSEEKTKKSNDNGFINKIKGFLKEDDEDELLDLTPDKYKEVVYGQGDISDETELEKDKEFEDLSSTTKSELTSQPEISTEILKIEEVDEDEIKEIEETKEKESFFGSFKNMFGSQKSEKKTEQSPTVEDSNIEDIDISSENYEDKDFDDNFTYADNSHTIRYSKTVIDSYLKDHDKENLDKDDFEKNDKYVKEKEIDSNYYKTDDVSIETEADLNAYLNSSVSKEETYKDIEVISVDDDKQEKVKKDDKPSAVSEFFSSIGKFFSPSKKSDDNKKKDNIDIIFNSPVESSDTMPLVLSKEEREILNKELGKRQGLSRQEEALIKSNDKVKPIIRKLIGFGALLIIPLILISLGISIWTISWVVDNRIFVILLGFIKFLVLYGTIAAATNSAFSSIGLRLKSSVINLFVQLQMIIYLFIDTIFNRITFVEGESIDALIHVFSPKILTIVIFVILAILLLMANFNKIKERNGTIQFLGWYLVIAITITLVVILLELLLSTALFTFFSTMMFN